MPNKTDLDVQFSCYQANFRSAKSVTRTLKFAQILFETTVVLKLDVYNQRHGTSHCGVGRMRCRVAALRWIHRCTELDIQLNAPLVGAQFRAKMTKLAKDTQGGSNEE